ncbi:MAG: hypothetical protein HYZ08_02185 [Candidatus Kerfeldbacteria bacterium]|nr:hypothetical protein [Candidatus Kerfeldbacteria bacterium]
MGTLKKIFFLLRDTFILPYVSSSLAKAIVGQFDYVFLIHPRNHSDYFRQYPFLKYFPKGLITLVVSKLGPITVSKISGAYNKDGKIKKGILLSLLMTPDTMIADKDLARKKILLASSIGHKLGAKIMGLGALSASITDRGMYLSQRSKIGITTGHAFTVIIVVRNLLRIMKKMGSSPLTVKVGVIGAAGSVGDACFRLLLKKGIKNFVLIDKKVESLRNKLETTTGIVFSDDISQIKSCDYIITATNAPYAILRSTHTRPGTIILDDAQPTDVHSDVEERDDVMVIDAGVCRLSGVVSNFNMGLLTTNEIFGCLAETIALSWLDWEKHYTIGDVTESLLENSQLLFDRVGFEDVNFRRNKKIYTDRDIERIKKIRSARHEAN